MYEYRKLTAQEREEILLYRQKQGYPLHAPPHPAKGEGHFLITAASFEHQHTMYSHLRRTEFELLALDVLKNASINPIGWIVMPNHYHLLIHTGHLKKYRKFSNNFMERLLENGTALITNLVEKCGSNIVIVRFEAKGIFIVR